MRNPESVISTMSCGRDLDQLVLRRLLICLLLGGLLHIHADLGYAAQPAQARAVLRGRTIELKGTGGSFQIPQAWLDWQAKYRENIHLSPAELASVRVADSEWDTEYAEILNALLPFSSCVAHAGGEGWGKNAVSYGDVQMRGYIVEMSPKQVMKRMAKVGPSQAFRYSKKVSLTRSRFKKWQRVTLSYDLWYSDYGGTANVDVFSRVFGNQTVVLAFMYADSLRKPRGEVAQIVKSFSWKP
jgi:hypothetical protein